MKFTEGYWLRSERANAYFSMQVFSVQKTDYGMRIVTTVSKCQGRGDTLNLPTITIEFTAVSDGVIGVKEYHHLGYNLNSARFSLNKSVYKDFKYENDGKTATLFSGSLSVKVDLNAFSYSFIGDGKVLSTTGFRNLGYIRWDKKPASMLPNENYLKEHEYTPYMLNELSLSPGEYVYGLGERFTNFTKNGQTVDIWNEDGGTSSQVSYKNIPFYMTNNGYGVFVDHTEKVSFEVASEKVEYVGFSVEGEELRYYFIYGPKPKTVLERYTDLTGKPALPPAWTFGLWLSSSFTTEYDENTVKSLIEEMKEREIPLSVFHYDCFWLKPLQFCDLKWNEEIFPDVKGMLKRYHDMGLKICVWMNPYVAQESEIFNEALNKGYFVKRADGKGIWQTDNWQAGTAIIDFTNPEAYTWFKNKIKELLNLGVDCLKTDFGERIPVDVIYYNGADPKSMHNYYTYLYNECVFNAIKEAKGESEAVLFARSATVGSQKFPVHWGGDCSASYSSMAETLRGGLSFSMSGFSFWSHDIGGFENTASADVYKRWLAFGLTSTHSRLHGSSSYRVPWAFDEESCEVAKFFTKLKCKLMPYIYVKAIEASKTGVPVMRSMVFEYPDDPACTHLDMQYMLGDSLLIAPVFNENGTATYYLPDGRWTSILDGTVKYGGKYYTESFDYFSLPYFVKENTLLVLGKIDDKPDYEYEKNFELKYYIPKNEKVLTCIPTKDGKSYKIAAIFDGKKIIIESELDLTDVNLTVVNENGKETNLKLTKQGASYTACL